MPGTGSAATRMRAISSPAPAQPPARMSDKCEPPQPGKASNRRSQPFKT